MRPGTPISCFSTHPEIRPKSAVTEALQYRGWQILVRVAQHKERIKYGQLATELQIHHRVVSFVLGKIQDYCQREKFLPLTILVQNKKGVIGSGFIAWDTDDLETGLLKVYGFNWNQIQNPFNFASDGATPVEIASALTKRTVSAKDIYARVRVRGMGQMIFRETLLQVYAGCCAFSGFEGAALLEAVHILRWADCNPDQRLEPSNGILLSGPARFGGHR